MRSCRYMYLLAIFLLLCGAKTYAQQMVVPPVLDVQSQSSSQSSTTPIEQVASTPLEQVALPAPSTSGSKVTKIFKSDTDTRNYKYITLENNLRALLIYDATAEKSAASLTVQVGSHQNPKNRPGLAHFLEHMLFLGTEKYPAAGEYQNFIGQHGGENNAYTSEEYTNYFFDIDHAFLEPAIDRFSQFFISPLFDATYVEREKNAVDAEYRAKLNQDDQREWDVYRSLFNSEHPAAQFSVGSVETLADAEGRSARDDLIEFYQSNYSANLMTLVVVSNQRLDKLQKMVESHFNQIPNKNKVIADANPTLFAEKFLPASVSIKPVKELRKLSISFPVPNYVARYQSKPWDYFAHLLGDESNGSLLSLLKSLGWAETIEVGESYKDRQQALFEISIGLTKEGVKAQNQIISVVFDFFKIISSRGMSEWRFNEMRQLAELDFRFHEKQTAIELVSELSQDMQDYAPQDVLLGKYAYTQYDESLLKQAFSFLRKDNALIVTVAPEVNAQSLSHYYQTSYTLSAGIADILELKPVYHQKLSLPERNIFIPKNTAVKSVSMLSSQESSPQGRNPALIINEESLQLWFLQDTQFRSPKAELNLRFRLPALNGSLENAARLQLFTALVVDQLNEYAYPAKLAGLTFSLNANARGFDINIEGYTDKQSLLVNKIVDALSAPDFAQNRFEKIKDDSLRHWRNEDKNLAYKVLMQKIPRLQYMPYWGARELAEGLQSTAYEQLKTFSNEILRGAKVDAFFYGNLYQQDAIKLAALVEHQLLQKKSNRLPQMAKVLNVDNKNNKSWLYVQPLEHADRTVELYIPALSPNADDAAHMMLLNQLLEPSFYNQLRTEKQLGYIVNLSPIQIRNLEGSLFVVQSPTATTDVLVNEIDSFVASAAQYFAEGFAANKSALLAQLRENPLSLQEQSEKYWQGILLGDVKFSRQQELIAATHKITIESLTKYFELAFLQKKRRLWLTNEKSDATKEFELIQNVADYQQKTQGYLYP